ncbi:PrsW family glutamic-type intramembrane protease [Cerasicoccus arenae]|nr:PrsW family glutamic-type intramembrane protease [Cerasicoccus arenae]MBK1857860.1 PrsW family intramembrane metalloprotease [Cerasicoccus arenae]
MRNFFRKLPHQSYRGPFLWKTALMIIALGIGVGFAFHIIAPDEEALVLLDILKNPDDALDAINELTQTNESPFDEKLDEWAMASRRRMTDSLLDEVDQSSFTDQEKSIARMMLESIRGGSEPEPNLVKLAEDSPPVPNSNYALGAYWVAREYYFHAAKAFELEAAATDNESAREQAVDIYWFRQAYSDLIRLMDQPGYEELLTDDQSILLWQKAILEKNWSEIIKRTIIRQYTNLEWQIVLIALLAGFAWFAFLMHAARLWKSSSSITLCVVAVLLGMMSTTATLLMITLQEDFLGFSEKNDLIGGLLYCIAGIGLREEFLKLLFFTPLLPVLVRRKDPLLALIVAGCVGLGFAVEENMSYFHSSNAFDGPGRFLTANFFHISATALIGYALYRVFITKWQGLDYFASMFGMVVIAHGLYDAFIIVPELIPYSFFSMMIYVLLCFQMFQILDQIRPHKHQKISLSFVFTLSLSVVLAICLGWGVSLIGYAGIQIIGPDVVGLGIVVIMFFRAINEPITNY